MRRLDGTAAADALRTAALDRLDRLRDAGVDPCLATVLASDDPGDEAFMDRKHELCASVGIDTRRVDLSPDVAPDELYRTVADLGADPAVTALFVQIPLPSGVDDVAVRRRVPPSKDVDCFNPTNLGRFVAGDDPPAEPATARAVARLLAAHDIDVAGRDAVVVGRTPTIGRPIAHRLCRDGATVTVAHSRTRDLGAVTRRADLVVTAAGSPGLVDGSMLSSDAVVVDVSVNRVAGSNGTQLVGDVDPAVESCAALTPVPGGVGPVTLSAVLDNVVRVTAAGAGVSVQVP
jgi:methylenetetrahydrofolate dehydrogenase (NADP+)/methenyltetrahydrofolate cyclohydrolase